MTEVAAILCKHALKQDDEEAEPHTRKLTYQITFCTELCSLRIGDINKMAALTLNMASHRNEMECKTYVRLRNI